MATLDYKISIDLAMAARNAGLKRIANINTPDRQPMGGETPNTEAGR